MEEQKEIQNEYALSNDFIRLPNSMAVNVLKLFGLVLSKVNWHKENVKDSNGLIHIQLDYSEVKKALETSTHNYDYYKDTLSDLQSKAWIKYNEHTIDAITDKKYKKYTSVVLFPNVQIDDQKGVINITINNSINGFIEMLTENFTVFKLANTMKFKSRYAYVLYMNLCSWQDHSRTRTDQLDERTRYYTTQQLKDMFGLEENSYTYKGHFERQRFEKQVINVAVDEINKYSNLKLECTKEYEGKRVARYVFNYYRTDTWEDENTGYYNY